MTQLHMGNAVGFSSMPVKPLQNWTFLVGAGVSLAPPSSLPDGSAFAGIVFDLLTQTGRILHPLRALSRLRNAVQKELRLETFLETLASEISPEIVFASFEMLRPVEPNLTHFIVTALSSRVIVTANQDLLFEKAAKRLAVRRRIIHLHGKCSRIASIVTIISQYLGGLERHVLRSFRDVVAEGQVIVLGYSGRDRDVMPVLVTARPRKIKWILHTGSDISPELEYAKAVLGRRLEIILADTRSWLRGHLSEDDYRRIQALEKDIVPKPLLMPRSVEQSFRGITLAQRNHAIAKLLEHLGEYREATRVYQYLARESDTGGPRLIVDLARVTARVAGQYAARKIFLSLLNGSDIPPEVQAQALLGNIDALRNSSQPTEAIRQLATLDQLLKHLTADKTYWRLRGWSLSARAGIRRLEGGVKVASRLYGRAERAFSRARDIDGRIEVLTWRAESVLILGQYKLAFALSEEAIRDAVAYGKYLVRGWPSYVKAEVLALSGRCDEALGVIADARKIFEKSKNIQGPLWSSILEADCLRETCPEKVDDVLREVRDGLRTHQLPHVQSRLCLEEAEVARAAGDWFGVEEAIAALRTHLKNKACFTAQPRLLKAHALLVEAECARQRRCEGAVKLLRRAREEYQRIGAKAFVARVNVAMSLAGQSDIRVSKLLVDCRHEGYCLEVARLEKVKRGFYPIHFV